jgi:hypothetical protein
MKGIIFLASFSVGLLLVYRKATAFYFLILYSCTLLKMFIISKSVFEVGSLEYFKYRIISLYIGIVQVLPFLFISPLFLSPALLLWLIIQVLARHQWFMPIILATWKAEIGRIMDQGHSEKGIHKTSISINSWIL